MGYTHYWTQRRNFSKAEWEVVLEDIGAILTYAQHDGGIPLADCQGDHGTSPEITSEKIWFNGLGEDSHEAMCINRTRVRVEEWQRPEQLGWDFCKTARKPYDPVVIACLCYLSTITRKHDPATGEPIIGTEAFDVTSDGHGSEFVGGLDLARKALPAKANLIDIPIGVMKSDRWCAPWVSVYDRSGYDVHFCVDGKGYVIRRTDGESYCFESHKALGSFLDRHKQAVFPTAAVIEWGHHRYNEGKIETNIWNATGTFNGKRHDRIARAQQRVLKTLFPVDPACAQKPPLYVRPGEMPANGGRDFCYDIADLLALAD
jgi:hypothetical protein